MMLGQEPRPPAPPVTSYRVLEAWASGRGYPFEVVGESRYEIELQKVVRRHGGGHEGEIFTTAVLLPEPTNPYDPNAVAVTVDQLTVGYIPRERALEYSPLLKRLAHQGILVSVPSRVWWRNEDEWWSSVRLDLNPPGLLFPVNAPPSTTAMQLPPGGAVQVTGEEEHMDVLGPLLQHEKQVAAIATMHEITERKARSSKQVIEVRIDHRPVGRLTPAMSSHFLPVVRHAAAIDVSIYTRAEIRGNLLRAEVIVYPTKAADLPQTWIDRLSTLGPRTVDITEPEPAMVSSAAQPVSVAPAPAALPPAAWYPNPSGSGWRWWNGTAWTEHIHDQ